MASPLTSWPPTAPTLVYFHLVLAAFSRVGDSSIHRLSPLRTHECHTDRPLVCAAPAAFPTP